MKKPKSAQKQRASQKRGAKRTERKRKKEAAKHARNLQKKNTIASQTRKFNEYMRGLLSNPEIQAPPQE